MLTNEKIAAIHANAVAHGFWEPGSEPTFGEYCAFIHEEISEAFSAWRNNEPDEYVVDGKPEGVWVELADVVIRCADWLGHAEHKTVPFSDKVYLRLKALLNELEERKFAAYVTMLHDIISKIDESVLLHTRNLTLEYLVLCVYAFAEVRGIDLDAIIDRKCAYNATRPYRHGKRM
jgi:NTP pyrophosphatase (non-canonical NTP hydrolase)